MTAKRILFFAEAVTLAHVARPLTLAHRLAAADAGFDMTLACHPRYQRFMQSDAFRVEALDSIDSTRFLRALAKGTPVYSLPILRKYLREDLRLIERIRPDLIIGDFRLSLSVSARLAGIPYAAITNAYWSPRTPYPHFPLPVLPMTRILPIPVAGALFRAARPLAFALHCRPLNRLRRENGLSSLGNDLRRIYTDADHLLYADDPMLFPLRGAKAANSAASSAANSATHFAVHAADHVLGPLPWSPAVPLPAGWDALDTARPTIYMTMGSSGTAVAACRTFAALAMLDVNLLVATAGVTMPNPPPGARARLLISDYLPGEAAAARAQLVVCNGGSPTSQQALAAGIPVLGIAGNMDQFLNMQALVRGGVGRLMRADRLQPAALQRLVLDMLADPMLAARAATHKHPAGNATGAVQDLANLVNRLIASRP